MDCSYPLSEPVQYMPYTIFLLYVFIVNIKQTIDQLYVFNYKKNYFNYRIQN